MIQIVIALAIVVFLFGVEIGSFLNVCIYRIPKHEDIVKTSSHCMTCGHKLSWLDLIPLFSYVGLRGRCRYCKTKLSVQYPVIEAVNGILYVIVLMVIGPSWEAILIAFMGSALLALSVIDFRTYEIPVGFNVFIGVLGIIYTILDYSNWMEHLIGLVSVSLFLTILFYASKGRAIGGGDVKLMAACGLLVGWKLIVLGFLFGCILGSVIHVARMKISAKKGESIDHVLAMGPYLSAGVMIATLWGEQIIDWYIGCLL